MLVALALILHISVIWCQNELKQNKTETPFNLKCPDGSFISSVTSIFKDSNDDHRNYKISCADVQTQKEIACATGPETHFHDDFTSGCSSDEFIAGIESTQYKDQDRKFRFLCCFSEGVKRRASSLCTNLKTRSLANFQITVPQNRMIQKISSQYIVGKRNDKFVADRAFEFQFCEFETGITTQKNQVDQNGVDRAALLRQKNSSIPQGQPSASFAIRKIVEFNQKKNGKEVPANANNENSLESTPFQNFDIKCPTGSAIRSMVIKSVEKNSKRDASFALKCDRLPDYVDTNDIQDQILGYNAKTDGSVQSPCNVQLGQFLCGLRGTYDDRREVEAHCCLIKDTFPSVNQNPISVLPTKNGSEIKPVAIKEEFIGNLDQLADGTFVAQNIAFGKIYSIKGTLVLTDSGCRCKCACECPNKRRKRSSIQTKEEFQQLLNPRNKREDCSGNCECKCVIPNCN